MNPWKIRKFLSDRVSVVANEIEKEIESGIWQLEIMFPSFTRYVPDVQIMSDPEKQAEIKDGKIKLWWLPLQLRCCGMKDRCCDPDNVSFVKWLHEWVYEPQKPTKATLWKWVGDNPVELWVMEQTALSVVNTNYKKDEIDLFLTYKDLKCHSLGVS